MVDRGLPEHARGLRRVRIELIAPDDADAIVLPAIVIRAMIVIVIVIVTMIVMRAHCRLRSLRRRL
jgi:hypothetical protein